MDYLEFLKHLHLILKPDIYLEIGVQASSSLALSRSKTIGIGPAMAVDGIGVAKKQWTKLYRSTSDAFFASHDRQSVLEGGEINLAFIDGLRLFEHVLQDFINIERWSARESVIVINDVIPPDGQSASRVSQLPDTWFGDVWKIVPCLTQRRPDLAIDLIHVSPSGLLIVRNLDPKNRKLSYDIDEITADYIGNDYEDRCGNYVERYLTSIAPVLPEEFLKVLSENLGPLHTNSLRTGTVSSTFSPTSCFRPSVQNTFDKRYWPARRLNAPLSGPIRLAADPVGLWEDGWVGPGPMQIVLTTTDEIELIVIEASAPPQVEDPLLLRMTVNGVSYRGAFAAGSEIRWAIPVRCAAGTDLELVLSGSRGFVPAEHGGQDLRRLTLHLNELKAIPDIWATRIAGPVSLVSTSDTLTPDGLITGPSTLITRSERPLQSVTINGSIFAEESSSFQITTTLNDDSWSTSVAPGKPFRWVLPCEIYEGQRNSFTIGVDSSLPSETSESYVAPAQLQLQQLCFDPKVSFPIGDDGIVLSSVLLSYNRPDLLQLTIESYLETVSVPFELIVVDNKSDDETRQIINELSQQYTGLRAILLEENAGGESFNVGLAACRGRYLHFSENDLEYLPGWDRTLLTKLELFPRLGQLSLARPRPPTTAWRVDGLTVYLARGNVMTPSVMPREVYDAGVRWTTRGVAPVLFPNDGRFSDSVKEHGYVVAWNDVDVVINHGFMVEEYVRRLPYYVANYMAKPLGEGGIEILAGMLRAGGYKLEQHNNGTWTAVRIASSDNACPS